MNLDDITFKQIDIDTAKDMLLNYHYLQRVPSISVAYGAYHDKRLVGILTIGKPASHSLCKGVCGEKWASHVYELNRIYTLDDTPKNLESKFIGHVLKDIKKRNWILISYADNSMNHSGYIYQATNWLYTGTTKQRTDIYIGKNSHSRHYNSEQQQFVIRQVRPSKHRYIYLCGDKNFKKQVLADLRYPIIEEYPKGNVGHYDVGQGQEKILYHKIRKEYFKESDFLKNTKKYLTESELKEYNRLYENN